MGQDAFAAGSERPETPVTDRTGHMGNAFPFGGRWRCGKAVLSVAFRYRGPEHCAKPKQPTHWMAGSAAADTVDEADLYARRLLRPLLSIFMIRIGPDAPVDARWVPPQA
jgi:hypothetical protein